MSNGVKTFSKARWLISANEQIAKGILTAAEVEDAIRIWVNDLDGKTKEEIAQTGEDSIINRDEWFM